MDQEHVTNEVAAAAAHHTPGYMDPDVLMLVMTWGVFLSVFAVLYKFAWKPILAGLDAREESIRKSVENAERIKTEMEKMEKHVAEKLREADKKSQHIIDESRHAASEAAKVIHSKAKEDAQIILENAQREIKAQRDQAIATLKKESAVIAVALAGKIIRENLDDDKSKKIVEEFIKEL